MKHKSAVLFVIVLLFVQGFAQAQSGIVAKTNDIENIKMLNGDVGHYINNFLIEENILVNQMKIEKFEDTYYLLANCHQHNWTYIIPLKQRGEKLFIDRSRSLNACETKDLGIDNFDIKDNGSIVCKNCNHKVSNM